MESNWQTYQVGYQLQSVRDHLGHAGPELANFLDKVQEALTFVSVIAPALEGDGVKALDYNSDDYFIGRILLGMLERGHPSLISPSLEQAILTRLGEDGSIRLKQQDANTVGVEFGFDPQIQDFEETLLRSMIEPESRAIPNWRDSFDSAAEESFFTRTLRQELGPALGWVEAQRPFSSMINTKPIGSNRYVNQRVDFALESPTGAKIVFEVDGPHHNDPWQRRHDELRDEALNRSKWVVERISAGALIGSVTQRVQGIIRNDPILGRAIKFGTGDWPSGGASAAARLVVLPHAIARVQLALLLGLMHGKVRLSDPVWNLCVIERDVHCAALAIADLLQQIERLCALYGIALPEIVYLAVIADHANNDADLGHNELNAFGQSNRLLHETISGHDTIDPDCQLIIDVSVRARPADEFATGPSADLFRQKAIALRASYRATSPVFLDWPNARPVEDPLSASEELRYFLQLLFRKSDFRPLQINVVARSLSRKDVVGLMPTGSGKTITFQLPTLLSPGVSLVITPLRSLMNDQVENLAFASIDRCIAIHSGLEDEVKRDAVDFFAMGRARFLYIAPERFQINDFRRQLTTSVVARSVSFVVVDEAHCVSEWGHDFRPAYLNIGHLARRLCRDCFEQEPPIIALTGTASINVLADIQRDLDIGREDEEAIVSTADFNRANLTYLPITGHASQKQQHLSHAIELIAENLGETPERLLANPKLAGLVICRHINGDFGVVNIAAYIERAFPNRPDMVNIYAGERPKEGFVGTDEEWNHHKEKVQQEFKEDKFALLVATGSFGMGIDKQNIRYTINYGIPQSIEALAQESGRAGRDPQMKPAFCAMVYTAEPSLGEGSFLDLTLGVEQATAVAQKVPMRDRGDISRLAYFHHRSFRGIDEDIGYARAVAELLVNSWTEQEASPGSSIAAYVPFLLDAKSPGNETSGEYSTDEDEERLRVEKAIYRLSLLGLVTDYTVNYRRKEFELSTCYSTQDEVEDMLRKYVLRYDPPSLANALYRGVRSQRELSRTHHSFEHAISQLVHFIYERIEKDRRRAILNLVEAMEHAKDDGGALKAAINRHLERNIFSGVLADIAHNDNPDEWWSVFDSVTMDVHVSQLAAACRRTLESAAENPGLSSILGIVSCMMEQPHAGRVAGYFGTAFRQLSERYQWNESQIQQVADQIVNRSFRACHEHFEVFDDVVRTLLSAGHGNLIAVPAYSLVHDLDLKRACAVPWLRKIADLSRSGRRRQLGHVA